MNTDWTSSLVDRLNEFARDNRSGFSEISTGEEAAIMIQKIHGEYNHMRIALDKIMDMTKKQSAFPHESGIYAFGITMRDYFAAHIAAGYIPLLTDSVIKPESVAKIAYSCATALMEERSK